MVDRGRIELPTPGFQIPEAGQEDHRPSRCAGRRRTSGTGGFWRPGGPCHSRRPPLPQIPEGLEAEPERFAFVPSRAPTRFEPATLARGVGSTVGLPSASVAETPPEGFGPPYAADRKPGSH